MRFFCLEQGEVLVKQGFKALGYSVVKPKVSFGLEKKGKENRSGCQKVSIVLHIGISLYSYCSYIFQELNTAL